MFNQKLLSLLLNLTLGASLIVGNAVYASGNPAESHDSTSPSRRVQDMDYGNEYGSNSNMNLSFYSADAREGSGSCSECQKQVQAVEPQQHTVVHKHGKHHAAKRHASKHTTVKHQQKSIK